LPGVRAQAATGHGARRRGGRAAGTACICMARRRASPSGVAVGRGDVGVGPAGPLASPTHATRSAPRPVCSTFINLYYGGKKALHVLIAFALFLEPLQTSQDQPT
jgi:hypothetical protein